MQLSRNNPIVNFYLFCGSCQAWESYYNNSLNLCNVFWNLLFKLALLTGFTVLASAIGVYWYAVPGSFIEFAKVFLAMGAGLLMMFAAFALGGITHEVVTTSATWEFIKGNYCPRITLK